MYLGIDLGTSSVKAVLADADGKIVDSQSAEYPVFYPKEGWSEQRPEDWYNGMIIILQTLGRRNELSKIEGVSFCGQMHGLVLLDENDTVIRPALLWNDNRTIEEVRFLNEKVGREKLIDWTGNIALTGFTAPKVLWVKQNEPENFARIKKIMLPKDYLVYKMSGVFASDVSDNSGTLYFDTKNKIWSPSMLKILGISETQLPKVFESYHVVGNVSKTFATLTGLNPGAKVIAGGGDQAVGAVGTGTVRKDMLSISLGSSGVVFASADAFMGDAQGRLHSFCHATGGYHMMGVILSAAAALKWWVEDILKETDFDKVLAEIDINTIDQTLFLPYLMGERSPINDPAAKGVFYGLNLMYGRSSMTKAVIEGVSFALKDCYDVILKAGIKPSIARVIGGGAKSEEWLQILSDILGIELRTINTTDGGAMGALMLAMVGCGRFKTVDEAADMVVTEVDSYQPDMQRHQRYSEKFKEYKALYYLCR